MARGERRVKSVEGVKENAKNNVFVFSNMYHTNMRRSYNKILQVFSVFNILGTLSTMICI